MPTIIKITTGTGSATYTVSTGSRGPAGPVSVGGLLVDHTLTSLTGETNSLASVATLAKTAGEVIGLVVGGILSFYQLTTSTAVQASPGVIRPADYNGVSNQKVWFQVL